MNEKIQKICGIVIKVCDIALVIAKTIKAAFPAQEKKYIDQEQAKLIKEFLENEELH